MPPYRRIVPTGLPAQAQYGLSSSYTPFTAPGQTITLTYTLSNSSGLDADVSLSVSSSLGNASCASPVRVSSGTPKACTFTYTTTLADVAASRVSFSTQWTFCDDLACSFPYTIVDTLPIPFRGPPVVSGLTVAVPYNSTGTAINLAAQVTGTYSSLRTPTTPANGSVAIGGSVITYTPRAGFYGADSFTFTATNSNGTSTPATVTLNVATPPAPTVANHGVTVPYNSTGNGIDLTSRISGVATSIGVATAPANGSATVSGNVVSYTPRSGFYGADSFTYTATGPGGTSTPATVTITVSTPPAPTVASHSVSVPYNSTGNAIDLTSRISGVAPSMAIATAPVNGSASVSGKVVSYAPRAGYYGADTFTYTATGPGGTSAPATVTITVGNPPAPSVANHSVAVPYNSTGNAIDLTSRISGVATSMAVTTAPANGSATSSGNVVSYTPRSSAYGTDTFAYTATGPGGTSAPATVTITIGNPPAPTTANHSVTVPFNSTGNPIDLTSRITGVATSLALVSGPANGSSTANGNVVSYTPRAGFYGTDTFTYTATGPGGTSAPTTVTITVGNPPLPTAANHSVTVPYNSPGHAIDLTSRISGVASSMAIASSTSNGRIAASGNVVTYVPREGFAGADSFTYTATGPGGTSAPATVTITILPSVSTGTVTINVVATGGNGTFNFSSNLPSAASFTLSSTGGTSGSKSITGVAAGVYTISPGAAPGGFTLLQAQCNGVTGGSSAVSFTMAAGGTVVCAFSYVLDERAVKARTEETVRNFMRSRASAIVGAEPDAARRHQRLPGALFEEEQADDAPVSGPGAGGPPLSHAGRRAATMAPSASRFAQPALTAHDSPYGGAGYNGSDAGSDGTGRLAFGTSLSQAMQANRMNVGGTAPRAGAGNTAWDSAFDIWIEGRMVRFGDDTAGGNRKGSTDIFYVGADYRLHRAVLIGALAQFDWAKETSDVQGTSAQGRGWLAGPYVTARLTRNVFFDARAAWGQSNNSVSPFGDYKDNFSTTRSLYMAALTGNWQSGAWRFKPGAELTYYQETQKGFTSQTGVGIAGQSLTLGRLSFGPEVAYRIDMGRGSVLEPYLALKALWDFQRDAVVSIGGMAVGTEAVRGKVEFGAQFSTPSGISIKGGFAYDGLGDKNFSAYEGKLSVNIPLQ